MIPLLPAPQIAGLLPATASRKVRIFSFGGGVQSHAVLALQAQGKLIKPYDVFVFANVGDDSENPATLAYIKKYTLPFCEKHGIKFVEVHKTTYGKPETLVEFIFRTPRSVPIPARMSNGAPGNRTCTSDFKITVVDRWIRDAGYTHGVVGLGISTDEFQRMRSERWYNKYSGKNIGYWKRREHPLIDMGISRIESKKIIAESGLPIPPKSSCYFCPFMRKNEWIELRRSNVTVKFQGEELHIFDAAVKVEQHINEKRHAPARDRVYLHSSCTPLERAVGKQMLLPFMHQFSDMQACGGYCHT